MLSLPTPRWATSIRVSLIAVVASGLTVALSGCHGPRTFHANRLPMQMIAPRGSSIAKIDWGSISRSAGNSEILYPGDVVEVTITTGIEDKPPEPSSLRIAENGVCTIPPVGDVQLAGLGIVQAEELVRRESIRQGQFVNPNVTLILAKRRSNRVRVAGAVNRPGIYDVPASQSDLLGALMRAEGPTEDAGTIIEIHHPPGAGAGPGMQPGMQLAGYPGVPQAAPQVVRVDLEKASAGAGDYRVFDGSTVTVMKKSKRFVHVIGLVNRPDQFEMPSDTDLTLLGAISLAGGLKLEIADKVHVMRRNPGSDELVVIEASLRKAKSDGVSNIRLAPDDVVSVEETPLTFTIGTIRDFVRFGFTGGVPGL